jgi:hypothetical protein
MYVRMDEQPDCNIMLLFMFRGNTDAKANNTKTKTLYLIENDSNKC